MRWLHILVILFLIFVGIMFVRSLHFETAPAAPTLNYTTMICDNAYQTETHHDDEDIPYFDVVLHEGCFSGFVSTPTKWRTWQGQILHNQPDAWAAYWFGGWPKPYGPYPMNQINSDQIHFDYTPSNRVRLQGKGTLRFYRITP